MGLHGKKSWSTQDSELLLKMKSDKVPGHKIASHFGVSVRAINNKFEQLKNPSAKLRRKDRPGLKGTWRPKPAGSLRSGDRWSEQENQILVTQGDLGIEFGEIGAAINRSRWACKLQYNLLKRGAARSPSDDLRTTKTKREIIDRHIQQTLANQPEYESLTAAFFRDPLPGRSALDQMRANAIESPHAHDRRYSDYRPKVTLATEPLR